MSNWNIILTSVIQCYILYNEETVMKIIISNSSSVPIYEQIKNAIKMQIMNGELGEDEALPSIRSLAQDIKISVMTIKKAYDELESEGYLISRQGKGTFVAPKNTELAREQAQRDIESHIEKIVNIAKQFKVKKEDIKDLIDIFYGDEL